MYATETRPVAAATNKMAYAQAFTRSTLTQHAHLTERPHRLGTLARRAARRSAR